MLEILSLPKPKTSGKGHRMIQLGKTIRYVREISGLTQRSAAEALGISDVHLCNIEHDKARPSPELLARIQQEWGADIYILAWCLFGDVKKLPKAVRDPMERLSAAWRADLERQRILRRA
jgi:transcriptional regulator with XRE-family HTH domain